jgi:hypothetical protein
MPGSVWCVAVAESGIWGFESVRHLCLTSYLLSLAGSQSCIVLYKDGNLPLFHFDELMRSHWKDKGQCQWSLRSLPRELNKDPQLIRTCATDMASATIPSFSIPLIQTNVNAVLRHINVTCAPDYGNTDRAWKILFFNAANATQSNKPALGAVNSRINAILKVIQPRILAGRSAPAMMASRVKAMRRVLSAAKTITGCYSRHWQPGLVGRAGVNGVARPKSITINDASRTPMWVNTLPNTPMLGIWSVQSGPAYYHHTPPPSFNPLFDQNNAKTRSLAFRLNERNARRRPLPPDNEVEEGRLEMTQTLQDAQTCQYFVADLGNGQVAGGFRAIHVPQDGNSLWYSLS